MVINMLKKIIILILLFLCYPLYAVASNSINILCNDTILKNEQETECKILANNLKFIVTSVSGEVLVSDNLLITESSYDVSNWKMFDNKFNVKDINLISEEKQKQKELTIASFKIKAINKKDSVETIMFKDAVLGDENYEEHEIIVDNVSVDLVYQKSQGTVLNKNLVNVIATTMILILLFYVLYLVKKNK